jgi:hypothetical protein
MRKYLLELARNSKRTTLLAQFTRSRPNFEIEPQTAILTTLTTFDIVRHRHSRTSNRSPSMTEQLILKGTLEGHSGWVTSLATSIEKYAPRRMAGPT